MVVDWTDFERYIVIKKGLAPRSLITCKTRVSFFNRYCKDHQITKLDKQAVEDFLYYMRVTLKRKNNTLNTYICMFKCLRDYLKDRGKEYHFLDEFECFKKNSTPIILLTQDEIDLLLSTHLSYGTFRGKDTSDYLDKLFLAVEMFICQTGCRFFEAQNLQVKYCDISAQKAMILGKNGEYRNVYFLEPLTSLLQELIKDKAPDQFVFTNVLGKKIFHQDTDKDLKRRAKKAGITKEVRLHLLRHCFGTAHYEATKDIAMTATLLGHKSIEQTYSTYVHMADSEIRKSAYQHPKMRQQLSPIELLQFAKESLDSFKLQDDVRYSQEFKSRLFNAFLDEQERLRSDQITQDEKRKCNRTFF